MLRFTVLEHHWNGVHWDFLLENGAGLLTWALTQEPEPKCVIQGKQLPDHRLVYLDYEGEISGNRGHVLKWDWGEFEWSGRESGYVGIKLVGRKLCGTAELRRIDGDVWSFRFNANESIASH